MTNTGSNKLLANAWRQLQEARPRSGFQPETEEECAKLRAAQTQLTYALYRAAGVSVQDALRAKQFMAGAGGSMLLELAFRERDNEK